MKWYPEISIPMDPDAILDYKLDFTGWLDGGTIDTVTATAVGCSVDQPEVTGNIAKIRVHSLTATQAKVTVRVLAEDGQRDDYTIRFTSYDQ